MVRFFEPPISLTLLVAMSIKTTIESMGMIFIKFVLVLIITFLKIVTNETLSKL